MHYSYPYPYYYDHYRGYVSRGGTVIVVPSSSYARPNSSGTVSSPGVTRGGFGSTGASHSGGSGGGE
jgi:hypothetical protein